MTASLTRRDARPPMGGLKSSRTQAGLMCGIAVAVALVGSQAPTAGRALVGVFGFATFVLIAMTNRRMALVIAIGFLVLLGFLRRALIPFAGWAENDPLLLVSPAMAAVLWYLGRASRAQRSFLSSAAAVLLLWCLAQVMNPSEPNFVTSIQSLLFYITPLLWFFVGRTFDSKDHDLMLRVVLWTTPAVVALGLYHSFGRFFPFELTWVGVSHQSEAIFLPGFQVRPFSTLTSPQEYGYFLAFVLVIMWAQLLNRPRHPMLLVAAMTVTTAALFLQASRSIFLLWLVALAVTALVKYRSPFTVVCILGVVIAIVAYLAGVKGTISEEISPSQPQKGAIQALIDHQLAGLTDPGSSTGPLHVELVTDGLAEGVRNPLGIGVSHGSIAAANSAPGSVISSESDIGNVAAGLGVFAGLALLCFIVTALGTAVRIELTRPSVRHLAIVGMGVVALGQWATGGLYCTSTILWFSLGGLAREWAGTVTASRRGLYREPGLSATTHTL